MSIKVAIVEDDPDVRGGLAFLIDEAPGFKCAAACPTAEEALETLPALAPDVVLMDVQLPGMSGIDCIRRLKAQSPRTQIMMLTVFEDPEKIFRSLAAGASGYLVKTTPPAKLLDDIRDLHNGGSPMSGQIARRVIEAFRDPAPAKDLTDREHEILQYLVRGLIYKEIARVLGISTETVRSHIRNIYEKLHVSSKAEILLKILPKSDLRRQKPPL